MVKSRGWEEEKTEIDMERYISKRHRKKAGQSAESGRPWQKKRRRFEGHKRKKIYAGIHYFSHIYIFSNKSDLPVILFSEFIT